MLRMWGLNSLESSTVFVLGAVSVGKGCMNLVTVIVEGTQVHVHVSLLVQMSLLVVHCTT